MSREDMAVGKDPAIKLFGRTIFVPDAHTSEDTESLDTGSTLTKKPKTEECKQEHLGTADKVASFTCSRPPDLSQDTTSKSGTHHEDSHGDEGAETKPPHFKRPDTILPCPRCNSPDTKFCYFNNYNVNQPRHFCKSCQRYWTAGGTVRNVPVGAGRRRNKQLASQYRQIIASCDVDVGPASVLEMSDPTTNQEQQVLEESSSSCTTSGLSISLAGQDPSSPNETVLKFGPGSPPCDEKASFPPPCGYRLMNSTLAQNCLQFVPGSYWNCIPVWVAGAGNMSLALANGCVSAPIFGSENGLQVLGKHPRDANAVNEEVVKTLRIHSVDRAA